MSEFKQVSALRLGYFIDKRLDNQINTIIKTYKQNQIDPEELVNKILDLSQEIVRFLQANKNKKIGFRDLLKKLQVKRYQLQREFKLNLPRNNQKEILLSDRLLADYFDSMFSELEKNLSIYMELLNKVCQADFSSRDVRLILNQIYRYPINVSNSLRKSQPTLKEALESFAQIKFKVDIDYQKEFQTFQENIKVLSKTIDRLKITLSASNEIISASFNEYTLRKNSSLTERSKSINYEKQRLENLYNECLKIDKRLIKTFVQHRPIYYQEASKYIGKDLHNSEITIEEVNALLKKLYKFLKNDFNRDVNLILEKELSVIYKNKQDFIGLSNNLDFRELHKILRRNTALKFKQLFEKFFGIQDIREEYLYRYIDEKLDYFIIKRISLINENELKLQDAKMVAQNLGIQEGDDKLYEKLIAMKIQKAKNAGSAYSRILNSSSFIKEKNKLARLIGDIKARIATLEFDKKNLTHLALIGVKDDRLYTLLIPKESRRKILSKIKSKNKEVDEDRISALVSLYQIESLDFRSAKLLIQKNLPQLIPLFRGDIEDVIKVFKTFLNKYLYDATQDSRYFNYIREADVLEEATARRRIFQSVYVSKEFQRKALYIIGQQYPDIESLKSAFATLYIVKKIAAVNLEELLSIISNENKDKNRFEDLALWGEVRGKNKYRPKRGYLYEKNFLVNTLKNLEFDQLRLNPDLKVYLTFAIDSNNLPQTKKRSRRSKNRFSILLTITKNAKKEEFLPSFSKDTDLGKRIKTINDNVNNKIKDPVYIGIDRGENEFVSVVFGKITNGKLNLKSISAKLIDYLEIYKENADDAIRILLNSSLIFEDLYFNKYRNCIKNISFNQRDLSFAKVIKGNFVINADISSYINLVLYSQVYDQSFSLEDSLYNKIEYDNKGNFLKFTFYIDKHRIPKLIRRIPMPMLGQCSDINIAKNLLEEVLNKKIIRFQDITTLFIKSNNTDLDKLIKNTKNALSSNIAGVLAYIIKNEFKFNAYIHLEDLSSKEKSDHDKNRFSITREFEWSLYRRLQKCEHSFELVPPQLGKSVFLSEIGDLQQLGVIRFVSKEYSSRFCPQCKTTLFDKKNEKCKNCNFSVPYNHFGIKSVDLLAAYNLINPDFLNFSKNQKVT